MKGNHQEIHVQFFDDPPTRGWVRLKEVAEYTGSTDKSFADRGGKYYTINLECRKAAEEADEAMGLDTENRLALIVPMKGTDEESDDSSDEKIEPMQFDNDIFDTEEDSHDNSKENHELMEEDDKSLKKQTPKKTPVKKTRTSSRPQKKRRRIVESGGEEEESGDEFKPGKEDVSSNDDESSGVDENDVSDVESDPETPIKTNKRKRGETAPKKPTSPTLNSSRSTPSVSNRTISKLSAFAAPETPSTPGTTPGEERTFLHLGLDFLQPENIRDINKNKKSSEEYDARTVCVPPSFMEAQSPAMRQWWALKAKHFDTVLFFKVGKFYELFHMDSVTAVNELGLLYMKGEHAHSGFPEIAFPRYADTLIQKGYKIARIEQTETPDMAAERNRKMVKSTKFDKVVRREICRVMTKGTKVYSFIDGDTTSAQNAYLLAICEKYEGETTGQGSFYGVCFVDTSIGKFHLGQFEDDRHCSRLRTLISHYTPAQVLYERGKVSEKTQVIINTNLSSALKEPLRPVSEFWESSKTLKFLSEGDYFIDENNKDAGIQFPEVLQKMKAETDPLGHTAAESYDLAIRALGAVTWYLTDSCLDQETLSMRNFEEYVPLDTALGCQEAKKPVFSNFTKGKQRMVLDGVTLVNLDILENSATGTHEGTLLDRLDMCCSPFGKRLFKQWLCAPLCNPAAINDRLNAVEDLINNLDVVATVQEQLKKLPDLERLLSKIHTLGSASRSKNHPDCRAIFFEDVTYSKRKIEDFLAALSGFKTATKIINKFKPVTNDIKSNLLVQTVTMVSDEEEGRFPDLSEELAFFENAFDHNKARTAGVIQPNKGVNPAYDQAVTDIKSITGDLDEYLDEQRDKLGNRNLKYWGSAKNRYQLEVPETAAKKVTHAYELTSQKKGFKRYWTKEIKEMLASMVDAEERRDAALKDTMRCIFSTFDKHYRKWESAVQCLSVLDVLLSMAQYSRCGDGVMCRPHVVDIDADTPSFIEIREGRHPCISTTFSGGDFIPNDTVVGIKDENDMEEDGHENSTMVLVTGPNMGGKSTLMRQVGVITIMAQLGCYVPAEQCRLTPVDRVFTRLGASDRIMAGESTFFVELSETSSILQHATQHSLVLLDELGRGTATYDGTAIACAVVNELSQRVSCRTLFSTHYHSLVEEFSHDPNVRLGHMACMVENENEEDPSQETITFLYKFVKGACPKSYGFNAARLADLPEEVIQTAVSKAKQFEHSIEKLRWFKQIYNSTCRDQQKLQELHKVITVM